MIFLRRRRLIIWLIKAYAKRLRKIIFFSFIVGLLLFIILRFSAGFILSKIPVGNKNSIGLAGAYTVNTLPQEILINASIGLTFVDEAGNIKPGAAYAWKIEEDGKKYTFILKDNLKFSDGTPLTSKEINYSFADVKIEKPSKYVISFTLKDKYSPFLVTVSKPIFKDDFIGLGDYLIKNIDTNGGFVQSIDLINRNNPSHTIAYQFYPTEDAVKMAFLIGEINSATKLRNTNIDGFDLSKFKGIETTRKVNQDRLVTIFFNTQDSIMSDKKIRDAFSYAIPNTFPFGQRNSSPFSSSSWAYDSSSDPYSEEDLEHAKILLKDTGIENSKNKIVIKTLPQYEETAKIVSAEWKKLGANVSIEVVESVPDTFQIFLGDFRLSKDPDQYVLWHSSEQNNISRYKNLRIDKLLEDGRKEDNVEERKRIYSDFQKYLLDDAPAIFLYLPYSFDVERK